MVQGWPYTPDTLAICSWVAAEDGDAGALAVLTASSRTAAPSNPSWGGASTQASFPGTDTRTSFTAAAAENRNGFPGGASRGSFDVGDIRGRRGQLCAGHIVTQHVNAASHLNAGCAFCFMSQP